MKKIALIFMSLIFSILIWACSGEGPEASESNKPLSELEKGYRIYKKYCVSCHGMDGKMGLNGAKDLTTSELSLTERKLLIANGKNTMTPFKSILNAEEITLVAKYTLSLSEEDE